MQIQSVSDNYVLFFHFSGCGEAREEREGQETEEQRMAVKALAELYGVSTNNFFEKMNLSEEQWVELAAGYKIVKSYMGQ